MDAFKRAVDLLSAVRLARELRRHDTWSKEQLLAHQQHALAELVRHATRQSPFYRHRYAGLDLSEGVPLSELPTIDKRTVLDNFHRIVGDPRLTLDALRGHIGHIRGDEYYLDEYRVVATSGTSGLRGIFVFDRNEWRTVLANTLRWEGIIGLRPKFFRRVRICSIGADNPIHVTNRIPISGDVGLFRIEHLLATEPINRLVSALNAFRPDVILPYPTVAALLAREQIEGRLAIAPRIVSTHSEVLTAEMRRLIEQAWSVRPFNHYGLTEEPHVATDCEEHCGMHVLEDLCILEIVDEDNRAVPDGVLGQKCLLTNLYNRSLPLIRYEVSDMLAKSGRPCPCGRPFPLIETIGGRSEDMIRLPGESGGEVLVPPLTLGLCVESFAAVREYEVRHHRDRIDVKLVLAGEVEAEAVTSEMAENIGAAIRKHGAVPPPVFVAIVPAIERTAEHMGKVSRVAALKPGKRRAETAA